MENNHKIVQLFPYQIKNRELFYDRDHPVNLNPKSPLYKRYWGSQLKHCIEGKWVDDEGTWVYLMPKAYAYCNYFKIRDTLKDSKPIHPNLDDTEWIVFTYIMCADGFSGFEGDENYTCHELVRRLEQGEELNSVEKSQLTENMYKPSGRLKKYINPWTYLTRHYLIDHPAKGPLGHALYENQPYNMMLLSGRGAGKSVIMFVGDFMHELMFSSVKRMEDADNLNNKLFFGMGCKESPPLDKSMSAISYAFSNMPGKYKPPSKGKTTLPPVEGAFFKKMQGGVWESGNTLRHLVKRKQGGALVKDGSIVQSMVLTKDKTKVGAGDRFRRIYIEEVGFLDYLISVHKVNKDSLRLQSTRVGSAVYLGTGGDIKAIKQPKRVFENPDAYDIFGIPDYWRNEKKQVGLFLPAYYSDRLYKDANGNTKLAESYETLMKKREKDRENLDSVSYDSEVMFNPITPDEMLRPSNSGVLPKLEASEQLAFMSNHDIFERRAVVGKVVWDSSTPTGVEFRKDFSDEYIPILEWGKEDELKSKKGAVIIYEMPIEKPPPNLYYAIFDPVAKDEDGSSLNSVLVYKHHTVGGDLLMEDAIVGEWLGRMDNLRETYDLVIRIAKLFNATIYPERNVAGFIDWCATNNFFNMLEGDNAKLAKELNPKGKSVYYLKGFRMDERKKTWALKSLRDWLVNIKEYDPVTGAPSIRNIDYVFSPRILNEIIMYDRDNGNFDHISSLLGLMLLINKIEGREPVDETEYEEDEYLTEYSNINYSEPGPTRKRRASILNY